MIRKKNSIPFDYKTLKPKLKPIFEKVVGNFGIHFTHQEDNYIDFNRQKLIPYKISDKGPATAVGDLNSDGTDDIFFGGSRNISSRIYIQNDTTFLLQKIPSIVKDSLKEDTEALIADFNKDGKNDLFVGSGGADFFKQMKPLIDSYFVSQDSIFENKKIPQNFGNTSVIASCDLDLDGDLDLFIGNQAVSNDFGAMPTSMFLKNESGTFYSVYKNTMKNLGMVTDAIWDDFDNDGIKDLIVVGEWMSPTFFKNKNGQLIKTDPGTGIINGLWQHIEPFDIDGDGDMDYLLGNWGTNTKFKASKEFPLKLLYGDFDTDGKTETITAIEKKGKYVTLETLDDLSKQMIFLKKKFTSYDSFAGKSIAEVFGKKVLEKATELTVNELRSGFLKQEEGSFVFVPFNHELQLAPILDFLSYDFDSDGKTEVLAAGNYFGVKPNQGRFDSFSGALIKGENNILLGDNIGLNFTQKSVRHLNIIKFKNQAYLLVTINNDQAQVYKLNQ